MCCGFCAQPGATFPARVRGPAGETIRGCALCFLAEHLERPRIDEEASLIWLPEMSQVVINTLMREIHIRLRALGETLHAEFRLSLDTEERRRLFHARALLQSRGAAAIARLGTGRPSDLASAMLRLSDGGLSAAIQAARRVAPAAVGTLLRGRSGYLSRDRRSLARGHRRRRGARHGRCRLMFAWLANGLASLSLLLKQPLTAYCDLETARRRRADHQERPLPLLDPRRRHAADGRAQGFRADHRGDAARSVRAHSRRAGTPSSAGISPIPMPLSSRSSASI